MHVYFNMIRLYGHIRTQIVYASICMYMYVCDVYACILHVYACIFCYDPLKHGSWCQFPKTHSLWTAASGPHSGHPRASGHAIFSVVGDTFAHPILRTHPPPRASSAPFAPPPTMLGSPPCQIWALWSGLMAHHSRSGGRDFTLRPENVDICMYMHVYTCICTYMHLFVRICLYMFVYASICMYTYV